MSESVFKTIGEEAEQLDTKEEASGLTELESVCPECRKEVFSFFIFKCDKNS